MCIFGLRGFWKCFQHDRFAADNADVLQTILVNATATPYRNTGESLQSNSERIKSEDTIVCTAALCRPWPQISVYTVHLKNPEGGAGWRSPIPRCHDV